MALSWKCIGRQPYSEGSISRAVHGVCHNFSILSCEHKTDRFYNPNVIFFQGFLRTQLLHTHLKKSDIFYITTDFLHQDVYKRQNCTRWVFRDFVRLKLDFAVHVTVLSCTPTSRYFPKHIVYSF